MNREEACKNYENWVEELRTSYLVSGLKRETARELDKEKKGLKKLEAKYV